MKVIIAVDESPYSKNVVETIAQRAWPIDTQFKILTVLEPIEDLTDEFDELISKVEERQRHQCTRLCEKTRERLETDVPGSIVHFELRKGRPQNEIIDAALQWKADRILLGAHGKDACPHLLLGSVSRAVASHAPCSVEIVRPRQHQSQRKNKEETAATCNSKPEASRQNN